MPPAYCLASSAFPCSPRLSTSHTSTGHERTRSRCPPPLPQEEPHALGPRAPQPHPALPVHAPGRPLPSTCCAASCAILWRRPCSTWPARWACTSPRPATGPAGVFLRRVKVPQRLAPEALPAFKCAAFLPPPAHPQLALHAAQEVRWPLCGAKTLRLKPPRCQHPSRSKERPCPSLTQCATTPWL